MSRVALVPVAVLGLVAVATIGLRWEAAAKETAQAGADELIAADEAFAAAAAADGIDGWMSFMADDAARMPEVGGEIIAGSEAIRRLDGPLMESAEVLLTWSPSDAYRFADGEYGITTGRYETVRRDNREVVGAGHYVSFWRRTADGWRVIFDTGTVERRD